MAYAKIFGGATVYQVLCGHLYTLKVSAWPLADVPYDVASCQG